MQTTSHESLPLSKPLACEPGSKWKYCTSGILTLGRIVEIVSGIPFEVFLRKWETIIILE
jgi:CubicO group peptidase (beta-lactamase class C family)